jgi:3-deoxy-D-manno-octulosonic acid (KDO) 8-phosphate synthase
MELELSVVELVWKTSMRTADVFHLFSMRLLGLHVGLHEVKAHVFTVNVLVDVSEAGYCAARLVLDFPLFLEAFWCSLDHLLRTKLLS